LVKLRRVASRCPSTTVEFRLEKTASGTPLVVTESGFDNTQTADRIAAAAQPSIASA
jgi:hypothetical protein